MSPNFIVGPFGEAAPRSSWSPLISSPQLKATRPETGVTSVQRSARTCMRMSSRMFFCPKLVCIHDGWITRCLNVRVHDEYGPDSYVSPPETAHFCDGRKRASLYCECIVSPTEDADTSQSVQDAAYLQILQQYLSTERAAWPSDMKTIYNNVCRLAWSGQATRRAS